MPGRGTPTGRFTRRAGSTTILLENQSDGPQLSDPPRRVDRRFCVRIRRLRLSKRTPLLVLALAVVLGRADSVAAQAVTTGNIGGVVKDSSGAVLPGVTVEA